MDFFGEDEKIKISYIKIQAAQKSIFLYQVDYIK